MARDPQGTADLRRQLGEQGIELNVLETEQGCSVKVGTWQQGDVRECGEKTRYNTAQLGADQTWNMHNRCEKHMPK